MEGIIQIILQERILALLHSKLQKFMIQITDDQEYFQECGILYPDNQCDSRRGIVMDSGPDAGCHPCSGVHTHTNTHTPFPPLQTPVIPAEAGTTSRYSEAIFIWVGAGWLKA